MHSQPCQTSRLTPLPSSPMNMRLALGIPLAIMALLLLFEPSSLDLWIADHLYISGSGFIGKKSYFLENILHDRVKQLAYLVPISSLLALIISYCNIRKLSEKLKPYRLQLTYICLAMGFSILVVMPLKKATGVQCPWSLTQYGGVEEYSSLMSPRPTPVKSSGVCWPGGHASAGFCMFALFFALRDKNAKAAKKALIFSFTAGVILSIGRMMQGAHFLSHNVWTMLIDWTISATLYRLILVKHTTTAASTHTATDQCTTPSSLFSTSHCCCK